MEKKEYTDVGEFFRGTKRPGVNKARPASPLERTTWTHSLQSPWVYFLTLTLVLHPTIFYQLEILYCLNWIVSICFDLFQCCLNCFNFHIENGNTEYKSFIVMVVYNSKYFVLGWRRAWQPTPVFWSGESHWQEPGGLQSVGLQRVKTRLKGLGSSSSTHTHMHARARKIAICHSEDLERHNHSTVHSHV